MLIVYSQLMVIYYLINELDCITLSVKFYSLSYELEYLEISPSETQQDLLWNQHQRGHFWKGISTAHRCNV